MENLLIFYIHFMLFSSLKSHKHYVISIIIYRRSCLTFFCLFLDCSKPLLTSGQAPKAKYFSSDKNSNPEYAVFNSGKAWCTSKSPLNKQYLEVCINNVLARLVLNVRIWFIVD